MCIICLNLLDTLEGTPFYDQQRVTIAHTTNLMQMQDLQSQRKPAYRHEFRINP